MARILVMNHNRDDLGECVTALQNAGHDCTVSDTLLQSIRSVRTHIPDLILLNPLLLDPSGVELEQVSRVRGKDAPIPLMLAIRDTEGVRAMRIAKKALGEVQDFIVHPFSPDELLTRVELILLNRDKLKEIQGRAKRLEGELITDFKTALYNDRHFDQRLGEEFRRSSRHATPLSSLLLDIDDFKQINDSTSYACGDQVLKNLAEIIRKNIRVIDFPARIGGDEFAILLPHTTMAEAVYIANRIREAVTRTTIEFNEHRFDVSISIGVSTFHGRGSDQPRDLLNQANVALKEAKSHGKNRIWVYSERMTYDPAQQQAPETSPPPPSQSEGQVVSPEGS